MPLVQEIRQMILFNIFETYGDLGAFLFTYEVGHLVRESTIARFCSMSILNVINISRGTFPTRCWGDQVVYATSYSHDAARHWGLL